MPFMTDTVAGRFAVLLPVLLCAAGSCMPWGKAANGKRARWAGTHAPKLHRHAAGMRAQGQPGLRARRRSLWLALNGDSRVHVLKSTDLGRSFSAPVEITREASRLDQGADARPALAIDRQYRITVGYAVMTDKPFTGELLYAHSGDRGASFGRPRPLRADPAGKRFLSFANDADGRLFRLDRQARTRGDRGGHLRGRGLAAAWSTDGGATFGDDADPGPPANAAGWGAVRPGRPVVVWRNLFGPARDHAVLTFADPRRPARAAGERRRLADRRRPHRPEPRSGGERQLPRRVVHEQRAPPRSSMRARRTPARRSASRCHQHPERQPARPQVLAARNGLWIAWQEFDGNTTTVLIRHSTDGGRTWSAPQPIAESTGMTDLPILIAAPDGRPYLSWLTRPEGYRLIAVPEL